MTGYGRGECAQDGFKTTVELSSVNRKQMEITVTLPRELEVLEAQIRDSVHRALARGRLTVRVSLHVAGDRLPACLRLNARLAGAYAREMRRLARDLKLDGPVTLDLIVRAPGVVQADSEPADAEHFWPGVAKALQQALARLVQMRAREGAHLAKDLAARVRGMRRAAHHIQTQAPRVQQRYRRQLIERVRQAGLPAPAADDERLLKEIVYFADRSDISEELARLQSHFEQFDDCLSEPSPVGRKLDFLAQEMNREINTIGSKANDRLIARSVVALKTELERFREQVQNVE
jgi:uncharacterized protein (TIGR00255 family)